MTLNKTELGALNEVFSYQGSFPYINIFTITGAGNIVNVIPLTLLYLWRFVKSRFHCTYMYSCNKRTLFW